MSALRGCTIFSYNPAMPQSPVARRFIALCVPYLAVMVADGGVTLLGQPAEYWRGDRDRVVEWSLTFNDLLRTGPVALVAGLLCVAAMVCVLILLLPRTLAMGTALAAIIGHTWGTATWLPAYFRFSYAQCHLFFICVAFFLSACLNIAWDPGTDRPLLANRPVVRWSVVAVLASIPTYLFLVRSSVGS
jgi:hypothetical protein